MRPLLRPSDRIGVHWASGPLTEAQLGEIIVARSPDRTWIVHRCVAPEVPLLKGDASQVFDRLPSHTIWGQVRALQPKCGPPIKLTTGRLDRWIARLSRARLRRSTWLLAWFRSRWLR